MNTTSVSLPTNTPEDLFHVCRSRGNWFKDYPSSAMNTITVSDVFWHEPPLFPAQYNISTHIIDRMVLIYGKSPEYLPIQTAWFAFLVSFRSSILALSTSLWKAHTHYVWFIIHYSVYLSLATSIPTWYQLLSTFTDYLFLKTIECLFTFFPFVVYYLRVHIQI